MNTVELDKTRLTIPELAELAKQGTVIVTQKGKPIFAVKQLNGQDWDSLSLAANPRFVALIEESRRSYREQGGLSMEEVRRELGLPVKRTTRAKAKRKATSKPTGS